MANLFLRHSLKEKKKKNRYSNKNIYFIHPSWATGQQQPVDPKINPRLMQATQVPTSLNCEHVDKNK